MKITANSRENRLIHQIGPEQLIGPILSLAKNYKEGPSVAEDIRQKGMNKRQTELIKAQKEMQKVQTETERFKIASNFLFNIYFEGKDPLDNKPKEIKGNAQPNEIVQSLAQSMGVTVITSELQERMQQATEENNAVIFHVNSEMLDTIRDLADAQQHRAYLANQRYPLAELNLSGFGQAHFDVDDKLSIIIVDLGPKAVSEFRQVPGATENKKDGSLIIIRDNKAFEILKIGESQFTIRPVVGKLPAGNIDTVKQDKPADGEKKEAASKNTELGKKIFRTMMEMQTLKSVLGTSRDSYGKEYVGPRREELGIGYNDPAYEKLYQNLQMLVYERKLVHLEKGSDIDKAIFERMMEIQTYKSIVGTSRDSNGKEYVGPRREKLGIGYNDPVYQDLKLELEQLISRR